MTASTPPTTCPAHIPRDRVRDFNYMTDPLDAPTPLDGYVKLRGEPHFWSTNHGGFWVLTDAEAIRDCFQDPETFSNRNIGLGYNGFPRLLIPEQLDPPDHAKYRRLLSPFFTPAAARGLSEGIREICVKEIDAFVDAGSCNFVDQFAGRFPQIVFLRHILNFPLEEMETFLRWEHDMLRHPQDVAAATAASTALVNYLIDTISERARKPIPGDLISELLTSQIDGRPFTETEALDTAFLLFLAGLDTVTSALSFAFHFLAENPGHRRRIVEDPAVIPSAVEELLRHSSFVSPIRTATRDVDFHGISIKEGERILPASVLAARDTDEFHAPDEVDFDRRTKRHMAFGVGVHRCLGSHLARLELQTAFEEFHRRIPDYRIEPGAAVRFHAAGILGADVLPLQWDPASR